jgi:nucleoid DNA-binding protein
MKWCPSNKAPKGTEVGILGRGAPWILADLAPPGAGPAEKKLDPTTKSLERHKAPCYRSRALSVQPALSRHSAREDGVREGSYRRNRMAGKRLTKAQVVTDLANATDLDKKSINRVFEALQEVIRKQLTGRGPGEFVIPGLVKLRVVKKPATKERQGINPFTKEPITIPAKPASKKVRATALKALKDLVQ